MFLVWCPECKRLSERESVNIFSLSTCAHIQGINRQPVYRAYCCYRKQGAENIGPIVVWCGLNADRYNGVQSSLK